MREIVERVRHEWWAYDCREAHETRQRALELALLVLRDFGGDDRLQRRTCDTAQSVRDQEGKHHPAFGGKGEEHHAEGVEQQSVEDAFLVADFRLDEPDQVALYERGHKAGDAEGNTDECFRPFEFIHREEGPVRLYRVAGNVYEDECGDKPQGLRIFAELQQRADGIGALPVERAAVGFVETFGEDEPAVEEIHKTERGGCIKRNARTVLPQYPTDHGTQDKAEAECSADHAEILRAVFIGRNVGDVGTCGSDARSRNPGEDASDKEPENGRRQRLEQEVQGKAQQREEDDGAAPNLVAESAQNRREDELHGGIHETQPPAVLRSHTEVGIMDEFLDEFRHHGNHDAPSCNVDE